MGEGNLLSLRWNNHISNFKYTLSNLQQKSDFSDAMIACEGHFYPVHKIVLATCSDYFNSIFERMPCKHPIIILKDVSPKEIEFLLSYMYGGEVSVSQGDLPSLIRVAETLHIHGLASPDESPGSPSHSTKSVRSEKEAEERTSKRQRLESSDSIENGNTPIKEEPDYNEYTSNIEEISQSKNIILPVTQKCSKSHEQDSYANDFFKDSNYFPLPEIIDKNEEKLSSSSTLNIQGDLLKEQFIHNSDTNSNPWSGGDSGHLIKDKRGDESSTSFQNQLASFSQQSYVSGPNDMLPVGNTFSSSRVTSDDFPMSTINVGSQMLFKCLLCDYSTQNRTWLSIHVRKHTGEKPHSCPYCPFRSAQKGNLNVHIKKIHQQGIS